MRMMMMTMRMMMLMLMVMVMVMMMMFSIQSAFLSRIQDIVDGYAMRRPSRPWHNPNWVPPHMAGAGGGYAGGRGAVAMQTMATPLAPQQDPMVARRQMWIRDAVKKVQEESLVRAQVGSLLLGAAYKSCCRRPGDDAH
jgi:hypothetical protein